MLRKFSATLLLLLIILIVLSAAPMPGTYCEAYELSGDNLCEKAIVSKLVISAVGDMRLERVYYDDFDNVLPMETMMSYLAHQENSPPRA